MSLDYSDYGRSQPHSRVNRGMASQNVLGRRIEWADEAATIRLAYVAAETGARFVRERTRFEPIEWLLSHRDLFDGGRAIDACRDVIGFSRAVVLHGLGLGYDAPPERLYGIPATAFLSPAGAAYLSAAEWPTEASVAAIDEGELALYSCSISAEIGVVHVQIFCAMIAHDPREVRRRLRQRYGCALEDEAIVRLGFDWSEPLACAMVSAAMAHVLILAAAEPTSSFAEGLDFQVEQRFAS